jgi:transcription elongation factor
MDTRSASVYMDESLDVAKFSLPLMFPIAHLVRTFSIGDNVRVLEGSLVPLELSGKTGAVVVVNESNIVVHDASSLSQVSVASGSFAPYHN